MPANDENLDFTGNPRNRQHTTKAARLLNQTESGVARVLSEESENFLERQYGRLLVVADLEFTDDFYDVAEVLIETVEREFYSDLNRSALDAFEHALTVANQTLADLAAEGQNRWVGRLNAVVAVIHENELHISQVGNAEAFLVRGPTVTQITKGLAGPNDSATAKTFTNTASGELEVGDKLLVSTGELFNHLAESDIRRYLYLNPPARAVQKIADQLRTKPGIGPVGSVIIELTTIDLISSETVSDEPDEVILGAPRRHFETLARFKPFQREGAVGEALESAKKWYDKRFKPQAARTAATAKHQARSQYAKWRGQTPPPPPPQPAAGTPETQPSTRPTTAPTGTDPMKSLLQQLRPVAREIIKVLKFILRPVGELLSKGWRRSGIGDSKAWRTISQQTRRVDGFIRNLPFLRQASGNKKLMYRNLIVALAVIFLLSILLSVRSSHQKKHENEIRAKIANVQDEQAKAEGSFVSKDIPTARSQIVQAKKDSDALSKEGSLKAEIASLAQSVNASYDQINNIVTVPNQATADLGTAGQNLQLKHFAQAGTTLYATGDSGAIVAYNQADKTAKVVSSAPNLSGSVKAMSTTSSGDVLILTSKPTVYLLAPSSNAIAEQGVSAGSSWENGSAIDTVQNSVYLLDPDKNQIWRHNRTLSSFDKGEGYVSGQTDLKNGVAIAAGAQVYVLKSDGNVLQFAGGSQQGFKVQPPPAPADKIAGSNSFGVNFTNGNVYVSDPKQKRVVEFDGKGQYLRQFRNDQFGDIHQIVVDDKTNTLFILSGNKLWQIGL